MFGEVPDTDGVEVAAIGAETASPVGEGVGSKVFSFPATGVAVAGLRVDSGAGVEAGEPDVSPSVVSENVVGVGSVVASIPMPRVHVQHALFATSGVFIVL